MSWLLSVREELEALERKKRLRTLRTVTERHGAVLEVDGRRVLNLASNDYLGFGSESVEEEETFGLEGFGAGASRLLSGNHLAYEVLEEELSRLYERPSLVFSSGYMANLGVLCGLLGRKDAVFADKLVHASLIDGIRLSGATLYRFKHLDHEQLEDLLKKYRKRHRRAVILTESVFSMDGDIPDLKRLVELKEAYDAILVVDEAHGVGVFGERGLGVLEELGLLREADVIIGTFGKALGSYGAFVVSYEEVIRLLVSKARTFVFTTALPPSVVRASLVGLKRSAKAAERRARLRRLSSWFKKSVGINASGLTEEVPIAAVVLGEEERALRVSERLFELGYFCPAVRPPAVPEGTSRLRISLSALMEREQLVPLVEFLRGEVQARSG